MQFVPATQAHLFTMMSWFDSQASLTSWGGPGMTFPLDRQSFSRDVRLEQLASWALVTEADELQGFGQYYLREGRCHLGRLVIAPAHRGGGLAKRLIRELVALGSREFTLTEVSLFVLQDNIKARRCYEALGFSYVEYPGPSIGIDNCLYMVARSDHILGTDSPIR
ncbi:GNAT family N-acetyltransferase [Bowmanella pacifica]|uniref:N-acetyltransferase domain-containing protein n=1 Tax=Bowmanella pacifica TaxID=502051 RepID=A0A918DJI0_9ALTE|nr:GNAT family N-acetyltransferase [Bowmanella pacifica]GGO67785.1 hypothetical protein GCM10010982_15150 [Bowmanella pacifica]